MPSQEEMEEKMSAEIAALGQKLKDAELEKNKPQVLHVPGRQFDDVCKEHRAILKAVGSNVMELHKHGAFDAIGPNGSHMGEMHANITLCYRHIEDAVMRLGKAIQAFDGGKSVYDK